MERGSDRQGRRDSLQMPALSVMLAEDDALIGILLAELLASLGHTVCAIESTEAAAAAGALRQRPDLMVIEAKLFRGGGATALRAVLLGSGIPFILLSGSDIGENLTGAVMLRKPFREPDLVRAIAQAVGMA